MRKDFSFQSRHERSQKRKQNLFLNILIGVVFVAIIAIGASILFGGGDEQAADTNQSDENTTKLPDDGQSDKTTGKKQDESEETDKSKKDEQDPEQSDDPKAEEEKNADEPTGTYRSAEDGGPDGPWDPVGTVQEGEHVSSFDEGSVDWKEKKQALQYATGLSPDEITYWWIGNGGSAQTVKGVVSTAGNKDNPYVVMLEWVDGEGWKPTSVERVPGAANQQ